MSEDLTSITTHHLIVPRTARIATAGTLSEDTKYIWIACHGYGEIASEFIASMKDIVDDNTYVVAPEALSRFYWGGGFDGKPVASWMTRTDRLNEIEDYSNYLSLVQEDLKGKAAPGVKFILFGFSQGAATVMRWANNKLPQCSAIVVWSGMIPEDIDYAHEYFDTIKLYCRFGDQDRFITAERSTAHEQLMSEKQLIFDLKPFEGKHKVYGQPLMQLAAQIYREI